MVSLALLGETYGEQLRENPEGLSGTEVVWKGSSLAQLLSQHEMLSPEVIVTDMSLLGPSPEKAVEGLRSRLDPELILVVYSYAKREQVDALQGKVTRVLQGPVPLSGLRSQMLSLIVRDMLGTESGRQVTCPRCGTRVPKKRLTGAPSA